MSQLYSGFLIFLNRESPHKCNSYEDALQMRAISLSLFLFHFIYSSLFTLLVLSLVFPQKRIRNRGNC